MTTPSTEAAVSRILNWEGLYNARDTGGLRAGDAIVRHRALVRSDGLARLTQAGIRELVAHGMRTVVDVRSAEEVARDSDRYPFRERRHGVTYVNLPFNSGHDGDGWEQMRAAYAAAADRAELNRLDIDLHRAGMARIIGAVADAQAGGVLVHCHAGKDRTGLVIGLILALVGVGDDEIADDYALSAIHVAPLISEWVLEMSDDPTEQDRLRLLADPRHEAMLDTLGYVRERYRSVEQYLAEGGLTAEQVDRLRERLLTRA